MDVQRFESFDALTREIIADRESNDMLAQRYAVRFIMLNNFSEFKELAKFMVNIGVEFLDLENLISADEDDEWITKDTLKKAIKECKSSTFVTPFSELARFYNDEDFRGFFNEIMLLEDIHNPKKRIYIPLIGLQNRFTDFLNHFARREESAPIWRYDAETQSVEVFFTKYKDFTLPNSAVQCQLNSLKEWLKFWKVQAPQNRIVCTSRPIAAKYKYSKPDNIFNFKQIANAYEFMTQFLDLSFPFGYKEEDKSYWEELLKLIDKKEISFFSFDNFVKKYFNKISLDASDILAEWANCNSPFEHWLLRKYVLTTGFANDYPYMALCMESVSDIADSHQLLNLIASRILYDVPANKRDSYAIERREVIWNNSVVFQEGLTDDDKNWLFERTKEQVQQNGNLEFAISLNTGVFEFEQWLLMGWYVHHSQKTKIAETIKSVYPEFAAYTNSVKPSHFRNENQWCIDYIQGYKAAKLQDKYTENIANSIAELNATPATFYKWYYEFDESHSVLAEALSSPVYRPDRIYWIDGLGAEFLSYILYLVEQEKSNLNVVRSQITRSVLPSSTDHNRYEGDIVRKFGALDELGHDSHGYKYLVTLQEELKIIKSIIHEIVTDCKHKKCTVAIVSDHGLSCLSRKASSKKYDGKFEHDGRYKEASSGALSDSDYLVHQNEEDGKFYKIALTHSSLSKVPIHQVHGGCTPEEVLVPFVILSNKELATSVKYQVNISAEDVMLSNPAVRLTIIPEPSGVELTFKGKVYKMDRSGTSWSTILQEATEGVHTIDVKPEGAESMQIKINIVGISGNSSIDDMFDL